MPAQRVTADFFGPATDRTRASRTPLDVMRSFHELLRFDLFVDGWGDPEVLRQSEWGDYKSAFVVPSSTDIHEWVKRCARENEAGRVIAVIIPARTDSHWFHSEILRNPACECVFIEGRVCFGKHKERDPSIVVVFRPKETSEKTLACPNCHALVRECDLRAASIASQGKRVLELKSFT